MDVTDKTERKLNRELILIMKLLAVLYPPGVQEVIDIPDIIFRKKSKFKLTVTALFSKIFKLIDKIKRGVFMKKYLSVLILSALIGCVSMRSTPEQEKELASVKDFPGVKKGILYNKSIAYIARSYNSANDVIQLKDPETGQIICKGLGSFDKLGTFYFNYTFIIDVKDNKIRTRFENITGQSVGNAGAPDVYFNWESIKESLEKVRSGLYSSISSAKSEDNW